MLDVNNITPMEREHIYFSGLIEKSPFKYHKFAHLLDIDDFVPVNLIHFLQLLPHVFILTKPLTHLLESLIIICLDLSYFFEDFVHFESVNRETQYYYNGHQENIHIRLFFINHNMKSMFI